MAGHIVTIKASQTGDTLARGEEDQQVERFEGNWYFDPAAVTQDKLRVTERTYTCPYKGTCYWIDLESDGQRAENIAWVYNNPKAGYEHIKGKYAFYAGTRAATIEE